MAPSPSRLRLNMNTWLKAAALIAAVTALSSSMSAQWPAYTPPGVPKTADGKPDLTAPAPRTVDGHPDLTGVWVNGGFGVAGRRATAAGDGRGRAGGPAPDGRAGAPPADGRGRQGAAPTDGPPNANFGNVGGGFPDGLPFTPWAAELKKMRAFLLSQFPVLSFCIFFALPFSLLAVYSSPHLYFLYCTDLS